MANIRIIGRMVKFSRLTFESNNLDDLRQDLATIFAERDYTNAPVVIHSTVPQDLIPLIQLVMEFGLQPIAVLEGMLANDARAIQFPVLPADQQEIKRITPTSEQPPTAETQHVSVVQNVTAIVEPNVNTPTQTVVQETIIAPGKTIYHDDVLRSGQSLVEEADIVLTANMNQGSEIIAAGNVYIYGSASGRIIAGASGDSNARIFCNGLEATLISIAGTYCVAEDIPQEFLKKPVQIWLNAQQELEFSLLTF